MKALGELSESQWSEVWSFRTQPGIDVKETSKNDQVHIKIIPNPIKDKGVIIFHINEPGLVSLMIRDILGNRLLSIIDEVYVNAGFYNINVSIKDFPSGIYFIYLTYNGNITTTKFLIY